MFQNVVIGKPIYNEKLLIGLDEEDFEKNEKEYTLYTEERFLPKILVEAGLVKSTSEVRRNKPELFKALDKLDCLEVKWGKKRLYIVVGE